MGTQTFPIISGDVVVIRKLDGKLSVQRDGRILPRPDGDSDDCLGWFGRQFDRDLATQTSSLVACLAGLRLASDTTENQTHYFFPLK